MPRVFGESGPKSHRAHIAFYFLWVFSFAAVLQLKYCTMFVKKKKNYFFCVSCCVSYRCVPTAQDLPPVGHSAAGQFLLPLLHWRGHTAAAEGPALGKRLQRMHPALLRPARWEGEPAFVLTSAAVAFIVSFLRLSGRPPGDAFWKRKNLVSFMNRIWIQSLCISSRHYGRPFFSRQAEALWPACGNLSNSVWVDDFHPLTSFLVCPPLCAGFRQQCGAAAILIHRRCCAPV